MTTVLNRAIKSALAIGVLAAASPAAFADITQGDVNAAFGGTPSATNTTSPTNLMFFLLSDTNTPTPETAFSLSLDLGLTFPQVFSNVDVAGTRDDNLNEPGLTLTWTITDFGTGAAATNFASLLSSGDLLWGVGATRVDGSQLTAHNLQMAFTVESGSATNAAITGLNTTVTGLPNGQRTVVTADSGDNASYIQPDEIAAALDTIKAVSSTGNGGSLDFYGFSNAGGASTLPVPAGNIQQYAGSWSFSIANGIGTLIYAVPGGNPIPLPAAVWLLLSGLAGMGVVGRRKAATPALAAA